MHIVVEFTNIEMHKLHRGRRSVVAALGAGLIAAASGPFAQDRTKVWRIGVLSGRQRPSAIDATPLSGFITGLRELGYIEGKNVIVEWRFLEGRYELIPELTNELVRSRVDILVVTTPAAIRPIQALKLSLPIVMGTSVDPVRNGFVASLARPGGNTTGLASLTEEVTSKHVQLMADVLPKLNRLGILMNPGNPNGNTVLNAAQLVAKKFGASVISENAKTPQELGPAFANLQDARVDAVVIALDAFFNSNLSQIGELALKSRLPSIYGIREYADAGGLLSYGANLKDQYRRAASYVDKIFKGANPGNIPVEQPTAFELIINMKAAKALLLDVPKSLLISADMIIE
ncbi:MAG: ABC transporter substrate-binding protein [Alcaligenaceae bacterium]